MDSKLSLSAKRQIWRDRYEEYQQSGLTQAAYCREHNLPDKSLSYWVRKYRREEQAKSAHQEWAVMSVADRAIFPDNNQLTFG